MQDEIKIRRAELLGAQPQAFCYSRVGPQAFLSGVTASSPLRVMTEFQEMHSVKYETDR